MVPLGKMGSHFLHGLKLEYEAVMRDFNSDGFLTFQKNNRGKNNITPKEGRLREGKPSMCKKMAPTSTDSNPSSEKK